ncbi:hypothetical protein HFD88_002488 [Aspergillus terreus]|nr:hypothetical protein HFD88_002488 [Aspergillus terreus]
MSTMHSGSANGPSSHPPESSSEHYWTLSEGYEDGITGDSPDLGDALTGGLREPISFKRKQKQPSKFSLSNLFSNTAESDTGHSRFGHTNPRNGHAPEDASLLGGTANGGNLNVQKESGFLDWYVEGPGRRVGYDDLTAIDWIFEYTKERQRKRLLYSSGQGLVGHARRLLDAGNVWLVLITTGVLVGIIAACIDITSNWLGDLKTGYCKNGPGGGKFYLNRSFCCWGHEDPSQCLDWTPWRKAFGVTSSGGGFAVEYIFYILYSVLFAVCASVLVRKYAIFARHSGIPEIKTVLGGFVIRHFMGPWTLVIKSLGLCLSVASGLWLGKEGPLVHVACCCANLMMKPFESLNHNEARKREVLSAAAAAGISVAFGAPIGGVLFSLEQLSYYFPDKTMWQSFVCAMVAAVTLHTLNPFQLVHSLFAECGDGTEDPFGLCKPGAASGGTIALLLVAAVLAFFLASATFGLDVPAGIILPSVAIGALYGRALGTAFKIWQAAYPKFFLFGNCEPDVPCVTPGIYAIIGAASALGGATRMTVSIVVIMFELTGALTYVIPIMVAVMLSKWCGDIFGKRGIYESWIRLNEYPFLDDRDDLAPPDVPANKVMTFVDDLTVIVAVGHTIDSLRNLLLTTSYRGFPVVTDTSNPILLGYISRNELSFALKYSSSPADRELSGETQVFFAHQPFADPTETLDLRPWMDQTPITLNSGTSFLIVLRMFRRLGLRYVIFADKGVLKGLLTKKDVWSIVNGYELRRDEPSGEHVFRHAHTAEEVGLLDSDTRTSLASSMERRTSF